MQLCKPFLVLHCNYNGGVGQKFNLVVTSDWGSYWRKVNASELHFARSFQGFPTGPYLAHSNTHPKYCIWPYLGAYLSALNMVKWGIPFRSIGPTSQKGGEEGGAVWRETYLGKTHFLTSVSIDPWTKNPLCAFWISKNVVFVKHSTDQLVLNTFIAL